MTHDFAGEAARRFIEPHLGPDNLLRYRFGDGEVRIRPGEGYSPFLVNEADFA